MFSFWYHVNCLSVLYIMADDRVIYVNKLYCRILLSLFVCLMVFNATFNNSSVISWRSVLLVEKTGVPGENPRQVASHWKTYNIMLYTSPWSRFELKSVVIGTDSIGSLKFNGRKFNYHAITATTVFVFQDIVKST